MCPLPTRGYSLSFGAPQIQEANPAPYGNTKEILIYNGSTVDNIYVGFILVRPTFPITGGALVNFQSNSTVVPAGTAVTLAIGPEGYRTPLNTSLGWTYQELTFGTYVGTPGPTDFLLANQRVGSGYNFVVYAPAVTIEFDVNVTYVQGPGGGGGIAP